MTELRADAIEELERLLDVERHAIRSGSFGDLADIAATKEAAIDSLSGVSAQSIVRLQRKAASNQVLLAAALKGVHAARKRLEMIQRASRSLNSYDALGRARTIGSAGPNVERRA
jgi:flagellar biosynthesis/type III secretory pathway chaperone